MSHFAKKWFDQLEIVLTEEARLAGLLEHKGMMGSAREFFVRRVLGSILPPSVHIGTGRVIGDKEGELSNQIDVILYDSRCPLLETERGVGLYFVEGVIATIEVKSTLTKPLLKQSLNNCFSVMNISTHFSDPGAPVERCKRIAQIRKVSLADTAEIMKWEMVPRTYVFAFNTRMSSKKIGEVIAEWYDARGESESAYRPFLPRLVAAPNTVAVQDDGWLDLTYSKEDVEEMSRAHGAQARFVMPVYPTHRHFGWLALHLIHTVHERLGIEQAATGLRFPIDQHLPVNLYGHELREGERSIAVVWSGRSKDATLP